MTNNKAIAEIENLKSDYAHLMESYCGNITHKEFVKLAKQIQIKIDALDMAIIALNHIEVITIEAENT